jgi:hypothetical protein
LVSVVTSTRSSLGPQPDLVHQVVDLALRRLDVTSGSISPVLHHIAADALQLVRPGSSDRYSVWSIRSPNSSQVSGRLSMALGSRNPWSTSTRLQEHIALVHRADLRHRDMRFIMTSGKSSGK